jgi:hypothetical protein
MSDSTRHNKAGMTWWMVLTAPAVVLMILTIVVICRPAHAKVDQQKLDMVRRQFQYGRDLVLVCRYALHDVSRAIDCENKAVFPRGVERVDKPIRGIELPDAGNGAAGWSVHQNHMVNEVRAVIDKTFNKDPSLIVGLGRRLRTCSVGHPRLETR